jgi:hypothetical protein
VVSFLQREAVTMSESILPGHGHVPASIAVSRQRGRPELAILLAFPLALLVAAASLGGIVLPATYARETANWAAQGIGQDWVDLLFAVPWLITSAVLAASGSRRALLLLAGGCFYTLYEFTIYAFAVHFNALFLVYCAAVGLSLFALAGIAAMLWKEDPARWYAGPVPTRSIGIFLTAVGVLFGAAWLAEILTALVHGTVPASVAEAGAATNPVHVIDLSVVLPLHVIAGVSLLRRRPLGFALAPIVLGFGVLMAASIAGLMVVMHHRGFPTSRAVFGGMCLVSAASAAALGALLRRLRTR